jgi:hypothetical protein
LCPFTHQRLPQRLMLSDGIPRVRDVDVDPSVASSAGRGMAVGAIVTSCVPLQPTGRPVLGRRGAEEFVAVIGSPSAG